MENKILEIVQQKYGEAARRAAAGNNATCCGSTAGGCGCDPITSGLYDQDQTAGLPDEAIHASLGCGNPTALAQLSEGQIVLDLGSGGGIDVLLSARRVGPKGMAYGLDATDEMLELAEENKRKSGLRNVHFLKGTIEDIPLPPDCVDVIISNCVINLSADKDQVLREAQRVLKPGGLFAVSDVVIRGEIPAAVRRSIELWVGCVAGALTEAEYRQKLEAAGFENVELEVTRVYDLQDARHFLADAGIDADTIAPVVEGRVVSAFVRARKPAAALCCGSECCR